MEAINVDAEYRALLQNNPDAVLAVFSPDHLATERVSSGEWVNDDGGYYLASEWDAEEVRLDEEAEDANWDQQFASVTTNFRAWLDEEEPEDD